MTETAGPRKSKKNTKWRRFKRQAFDKLFDLVGAPLLGGICNLWAHTLRIEYHGYDRYEAALKSKRPIVIAFWHEDLGSIFIGYLRHRLGSRIGVMLSQSRDGEKVAKIIERYDLVPIRASSSRGAVRGFLELYRWLTRPENPELVIGTIAVDGPRGPRRQAKAGAAMLARKAGAIILPVAFRHDPQWVFSKSWDKHLFPKPFAKTHAYFGEILDSRDWPDDNEANAALLTEALNAQKNLAGVP